MDPGEAPKKKIETYVDLPPSLKDIGKEKKVVDLKSIRAEHEREKLGDRYVSLLVNLAEI